MNFRRIIFPIVIAGCGLAVALSWRWESTRTAALEGQLAQLKAENAKLDTDVAAARAGALESAQLRDAKAISGTRLELPATPTPAPTPAEQADTPKPLGGLLMKMFKDPAMRNLLAAQQSSALKAVYGDFLKQTYLTPEETGRFFQLLQERQMAVMDSSAGAIAGGAVDMKAATAAADTTDAALSDLLGPMRFGEYREFEKTLGTRVQVHQFNRQLAEEGYPTLRDDQRAALVRIMSRESVEMPGPGDGSADDIDQYSRQVKAIDQRIYAEAKSVLSPEQLGAFAEFQENVATSQLAGLKTAQGMLRGGQ